MRKSRLLLGMLISLVLVIGIWKLEFDVDVLNLLPPDVEAVRGIQLYQKHFGNAGELVITLAAPDAEQAESAARELAQNLRTHRSLTSDVHWQAPWSENPAEVAKLSAYLWFNQPPSVFNSLIGRLSPANASNVLAEARERMSSSFSPAEVARIGYDPFGLLSLPDAEGAGVGNPAQSPELFASPDGAFRLIFVRASEELPNYRAAVAWMERVRGIVDSWKRARTDNVVVRFTGQPAFVAEVGGGMEQDMNGSVLGTMLVIGCLFYLEYRRIKPLLWLTVLLAFTLAATFALGGLVYGRLNIVSTGFAAILLGLAEDYAIVLYQEARSTPTLSATMIRRMLAPGIFWSAVTTASAFAVLNLSALPGLGQLGTLVAIGVLLSVPVMLYAYLPPLLRAHVRDPVVVGPQSVPPEMAIRQSRRSQTSGWFLTFALLVAIVLILIPNLPTIDTSADALRPTGIPAQAALDEIQQRVGGAGNPAWLIVEGQDESEIARRLERAQSILASSVSNRSIERFTLPLGLWPRPEFQVANREAIKRLSSSAPDIRVLTIEQGFTTNALALFEQTLSALEAAASSVGVYWPTNDASRWVLDKVVARDGNQLKALGLVYLPAKSGGNLAVLAASLRSEGVTFTNWELMGNEVLERVKREFWKLLVPMGGLLILSLFLAFRGVREVALCIVNLGFSLLVLCAVMELLDWSWNLLNLIALPLLLGVGVDFAIHIQLALRRHCGDLAAVRATTGRALLICGTTTAVGFGSLSWADNAGLASLGKVCGVGIVSAFLTAVYLLPAWWLWLCGSSWRTATESAEIPDPTGQRHASSMLYTGNLWRIARAVSCLVPLKLGRILARFGAWAYYASCPGRRQVVFDNLLPVLAVEPQQVRQRARALFANFGTKLADLWYYENGRPIDDLVAPAEDWEGLERARSDARGILLVTIHLGNWEFGAPLARAKGIQPLVISLAEPDQRLTASRKDSRSRRGIETLVIGRDPFAFVEAIRRLDAGGTVALLVDRPPKGTSELVNLFGKPIEASVSAAELARATGCLLLPVYVPMVNGKYHAKVLPSVEYQRSELRSPEARRALTQQIMRAFEPVIREYADQWYHFVPIWPK